MKNLWIILAIFFVFGISIHAENFNDPELREYLDRPFIQQDDTNVIIISGYKDHFLTYDSAEYMWNDSCTAGLAASGLTFFEYLLKEAATSYGVDSEYFSNTENLHRLRDEAIAAYQSAFTTSPTLNWSFAIGLESKSVIASFKATNVNTSADEEGTHAINSDVSTYGGDYHNYNWSFHDQSLVGKNVAITGGDGTTSNYHVSAAMNYSPIILDLDNDGKPCVNREVWTPHAPKFYSERTAIFDMTGDGKPEFIEWLGKKDGLLVLPEQDENCPVKSANNLFGTAGGYKDGYEKMAIVLDLDKNGWVEKEELNGLFVWRDVNGNAKVDKGELTSLQEIGVEKISVEHNNFESVCFIKGKKVKTWDWWPCGYELLKTK